MGSPFPLRLCHILTVGPWVGVCSLPWQMPGAKREGPDAFMVGKSTVLSPDIPPKAQVDLSVHHGWAGSSSDCVSPSWCNPSLSQSLSKRMFEADRVLSGGSSVVLPPLLGPIHFSPPLRNTGSWQLLAGLVLPEVQ